jgi:hypothetical protein
MKRSRNNAEDVAYYLALQAQDFKTVGWPAEGHRRPLLIHAALPRVAITPDDAAIAAGVSRTRIFKAISKGALIARGDGKATIIELVELARWVAALPAKGPHRATVEKQSHPTTD